MPKTSAVKVGAAFGTYTVVAQEPSRHGHTFWSARCKCGAERIVRATDLLRQQVRCACTPGEPVRAGNTDAAGKAGISGVAALLQQILDRLDRIEQQGAASKPVGLKSYGLNPDPSTVTAAVAEARAKDMPKDRLTKATILSGCSTREQAAQAYTDNHQKALDLAATPFKARTATLREELVQRWKISNDRLETMTTTDPTYRRLSEDCYTMKRALDSWHLDPATL